MAFSIRGLVASVVLVLLGGYFVIDGIGKLGWSRIGASVTAVDLKCQVSAEETGVLTRTKWDATIDCNAVQAFKVAHPDKTWSVRHEALTHLSLKTSPAIQTTMMVYDDKPPRIGDVLSVVEDPADPNRVLPAATSTVTIASGAAMLGIGALVLGLVLLRRNRGRPPRASVEPQHDAQPVQTRQAESAGSAPARPPLAPAAARVFGRR